MKDADRERLLKWGGRAAILVAGALLWEWLAGRSSSLMVPAFTGTVESLIGLLGSEAFWRAMALSNQAMLAGYAVAAGVGIAAGLAMGRWRVADELLDPYLSILLVTPMSAAIPVLIMLMGLGLESRVAVVFLFGLPAITVHTRAGIRAVEPAWTEMARGFGAGEGQVWRKVLLRGASPAILEGLRLGLVRSVTGMIATELLLVAVGLGRLLLDYQARFEAGPLCAVVVLVVGEAVILARLGEKAVMRLFPWVGRTALE